LFCIAGGADVGDTGKDDGNEEEEANRKEGASDEEDASGLGAEGSESGTIVSSIEM
jgi:hypothetical protein